MMAVVKPLQTGGTASEGSVTSSGSADVDILIIGAGIAGLCAARTLQNKGLSVAVLDKSRGVGGRLATRRGQLTGVRWDHAAQYYTVSQEAFEPIRKIWQEKDLESVWFTTLRNANGEKLGLERPRYIGLPNGMNSLAKALAEGIDNLHLNHKVVYLEITCDGWHVHTEEGGFWKAKSIIMTAPLPQSIALFDASKLPIDTEQRRQLDSVVYEPCLSLLAQVTGDAAEAKTLLPEPGYIKDINWDSPIAWVGDNYAKGLSDVPGCLTIHAGPSFSRQYFDTDSDTVAAAMIKELRQRVTEAFEVENWQLQRWRYAFVNNPLAEPSYRLKGLPPFILAGDAFSGQSRIETAGLSGLAAAHEMIELLTLAQV